MYRSLYESSSNNEEISASEIFFQNKLIKPLSEESAKTSEGKVTKEEGSCVLKASVDRVSVDTIGRYGDRHSADISTDTRPICRPSVGRVLVECRSTCCFS